jgi:AcrR family transcriptional regulator
MATQPPPALSLRERKKQRTYRELQEVALQLVAERGFDGVTTDDIAAAAEVSKTTFYRYFGSKEEVVLGNAVDLDEVRRALYERPLDEPVLASVRDAILGLADGIQHEPTALLARLRLMRATSSLMARYLEQQSAFERLLGEFIAQRRGTDAEVDLEARLLAASTIAALRVAIDYWLDHEGIPDLEQLVRRGLSFVVDGPPPEPAS